MLKKALTLAGLTLSLSVLLIACGGGDGSNETPAVNAGADQSVNELTTVTLVGSATDTDGTIASYSCAQTSGTAVTLKNANSAIASFTPPASLTSSEILIFSLTVSDNEGASQASAVSITVTPTCATFENWANLGLKINGVDVAVDSFNNRLFMSLADGYDLPQVLKAVVEYEPCNVGIGFDNGAAVASGATIDLYNIRYGSTILVDLYPSGANGMASESYEMVFTNLPVIELDAGLIVDEPKYPGTFKLTSPLFDQYTGTLSMGIEIRGGSSQVYEKKSYSIELVEDDDPEDERKLALLDLRKDGDWILDATYRDTSFVRNIISMDIYNDMRPYAYGDEQGQAAIRGNLVEVILNGRYNGVYILEEKVDRKLLDLEKVDVPEDAGGNDLWNEVDFDKPENGSVLYKASSNSATLYYISDNVKDDFEQKYPKERDIEHYGPLFDLITFLNDSSDEQFVKRVQDGDLIDLDSAVDFWIMTNLTQNRDTLRKNYYIARNMTQQWFFVPWDNDTTFGMNWNGAPSETVTWWSPNTNKLIQRLVANPKTGFNSRVKQRWLELRETIFTTEALTARFAKYRAGYVPTPSVREDAQERNFMRWPESGGEGAGNPELGSITYINDWIERRIAFLDEIIMSQEE
jgi:hypothetical protein